MALIHLNFHSDVLGMAVSADVILPQKSRSLIGMKTESAETYPTLWLLHPKCIACGICVKVCPMEVLEIVEK